MKRAILNVRILTAISLVLGLLMAVLNLYPSWSQYAGTMHDPLLYSTLVCISSLFMISGFTNPNKEVEITKIWLLGRITLGQCFIAVAYLFGTVITFSVNNPSKIIEALHLAGTGSAILFGYVAMVTYHRSKRAQLIALIGAIVGILGFVGGFVLKIYSVAWGEVVAAIPLAIFVNLTYEEYHSATIRDNQ